MTCELEIKIKNSKETNITAEHYTGASQRTLAYTRQILMYMYAFLEVLDFFR